MNETSWAELTGLVGAATALVTVLWTVLWGVAQERKREGKTPPTLRLAMTALARQKAWIYKGAAVGMVLAACVHWMADPVYVSTSLVKVWEVEPVPGTADRYRTRGLTQAELADERELLGSDTLRFAAWRRVISLLRRRPELKEALPLFADTALLLSGSTNRRAASRIRIESPAGSTSLMRVTSRSTHPFEAALLANAHAEAYRNLTGAWRDGAGCAPGGSPTGCASGWRAAALVDPARVPPSPVHPSLLAVLLRGLLLGGAGGLVVALYRAITDDAIREARHLKEMGFSVLGQLPHVRLAPRFRKSSPDVHAPNHAGAYLMFKAGGDPAVELYRVVCNRLLRKPAQGERPRVVLVTSAGPAEGKTTAAMNLAVTAARFGSRVVVVDADLRRGMTSSIVDMPREPGLSNLLIQRAALTDAMHTITDPDSWARLSLIASGTLPPNPSELLASPAMANLIATLRDRFDLVLIDSAPALLTSDSEILAHHCDLCAVVVRSGATSRDALREVMSTIPAPRFGVILNHADGRGSRPEFEAGFYGYGYGYGYQPPVAAPTAPGRGDAPPPEKPQS